jgi:hypothetical protein
MGITTLERIEETGAFHPGGRRQVVILLDEIVQVPWRN